MVYTDEIRAMPFLARMGITAIAMLLIGYLLPSVIRVDSVMSAVAAAFVLGLFNAFVRPLFVILTLPITVITLGLFLLVINALLLLLVDKIVPGFHVNGFWGAVFGSILISIVSGILSSMVV
jgi:putative membrane protein